MLPFYSFLIFFYSVSFPPSRRSTFVRMRTSVNTIPVAGENIPAATVCAAKFRTCCGQDSPRSSRCTCADCVCRHPSIRTRVRRFFFVLLLGSVEVNVATAAGLTINRFFFYCFLFYFPQQDPLNPHNCACSRRKVTTMGRHLRLWCEHARRPTSNAFSKMLFPTLPPAIQCGIRTVCRTIYRVCRT